MQDVRIMKYWMIVALIALAAGCVSTDHTETLVPEALCKRIESGMTARQAKVLLGRPHGMGFGMHTYWHPDAPETRIALCMLSWRTTGGMFNAHFRKEHSPEVSAGHPMHDGSDAGWLVDSVSWRNSNKMLEATSQ